MRGVSAGLARILIWLTDSSGRAIGQSSTLANGATGSVYVGDYVIQSPMSPADAQNKEIRGGDNIRGYHQFGNAKQQKIDAVLSDTDTALVSLISGSNVNSSANTGWDIYSTNPNRTFSITGGVAIQQRKQRTSDNVLYWHTAIFPSCFLRIKLGGMEYQGDANTTISITPNFSSYAHTGQTFGTGANNWNLGLESDKTDSYDIDTPNPIHIVTFKKDGTATTFNTPFKPLSTVVTLGATPNYWIVNGAPVALSSITLAGVATVSAGSAGDVGVLTYETNYVPS